MSLTRIIFHITNFGIVTIYRWLHDFGVCLRTISINNISLLVLLLALKPLLQPLYIVNNFLLAIRPFLAFVVGHLAHVGHVPGVPQIQLCFRRLLVAAKGAHSLAFIIVLVLGWLEWGLIVFAVAIIVMIFILLLLMSFILHRFFLGSLILM